MPTLTNKRINPWLIAQMALAVVGGAMLMLAPRAGRATLLIPVTPRAASQLPRLIDARTRLIGAGPFSGSLVVIARDDRNWAALLSRGIVMLAADTGGCGGAIND